MDDNCVPVIARGKLCLHMCIDHYYKSLCVCGVCEHWCFTTIIVFQNILKETIGAFVLVLNVYLKTYWRKTRLIILDLHQSNHLDIQTYNLYMSQKLDTRHKYYKLIWFITFTQMIHMKISYYMQELKEENVSGDIIKRWVKYFSWKLSTWTLICLINCSSYQGLTKFTSAKKLFV